MLAGELVGREIELRGPDTVAAFIGEPVMQANSVQVPSRRYWERVREICNKHGVLLIADEVITGFGRTGAWFASEHFGLQPDIMTMAKALSAGYAPIGAVITTDAIADAIPMLRHVHTFSGHASAAAAAGAAIGIKRREGLVDAARDNGTYFGNELAAALAGHPIVGQVRGFGMWHCVDFTSDRATKAKFEDDTVSAIVERMRRHGVLACRIGTARHWRWRRRSSPRARSSTLLWKSAPAEWIRSSANVRFCSKLGGMRSLRMLSDRVLGDEMAISSRAPIKIQMT